MINNNINKFAKRVCEHCGDIECEHYNNYMECDFAISMAEVIISMYIDYCLEYDGFDDLYEEIEDEISDTI